MDLGINNIEENKSKTTEDELSKKTNEQFEIASSSALSVKHINNNHHVVPVGVIIVLFTLYLTTAALQRNFPNINGEKSKQNDLKVEVEKLDEQGNRKQLNLLENVAEYDENVCKNFQIFTKAINNDDENTLNDATVYESEADVKINTITDATIIVNDRQLENKQKNGSRKQQKHKNGKNGNGHKSNNKSIKNKHNGKHNNEASSNKKDKEQNKKSSTAEPIIYLFALVFIYLLLKAASDINQHYKSQTKGDKRLRRCSLQSYAQTHKQDRRASKGITSKSLPKF